MFEMKKEHKRLNGLHLDLLLSRLCLSLRMGIQGSSIGETIIKKLEEMIQGIGVLNRIWSDDAMLKACE